MEYTGVDGVMTAGILLDNDTNYFSYFSFFFLINNDY